MRTCQSPATASSNSITFIVIPLTPNSVSISASSTNICAGTLVTFTATPVNGGATPSYQWKKNGVNVGTNSATYTDSGLNNNDSITCVMSSSAVCPSPALATSNFIKMIVNPLLTPAIVLSSSATTICAGTLVTFTSATTNAGTSPQYQWKKNGLAIAGATSSTYSDNGLNNGDVITCALTSNALCATPATVQSVNSITMSVNPILTPVISIAVTPGTTICAGTSVTFTSTITNGGAGTQYQWKKNGTAVGGATGSSYTSSTLSNNDIITCQLTSNATCASPNPVTSNADTMHVNALPAITSSPSNQTICAGATTSFTVGATGAGITYQWSIGANPIVNNPPYSGATTNTLTITNASSTLSGTTYTCTVSSGICTPPVSVNVTLTVDTLVSIVGQPANDTICAGQNASFHVSAIGTGLTYKWYKVIGSAYTLINNGGVYSTATTSTLSLTSVPNTMSGTSYKCIITGTCLPLDTSSLAVLVVDTLPAITTQPAIGNTICAGGTTTLSIQAVGTGITYQWQVNGTNVSGSVYSGATTNALTITGATAGMNGYVYKCIVS